MNQIMRDLLQKARHDEALKQALLDSRGESEAYAAFCRAAMQKLHITFVKVKGHSGDTYNDLADALAKKALGI